MNLRSNFKVQKATGILDLKLAFEFQLDIDDCIKLISPISGESILSESLQLMATAFGVHLQSLIPGIRKSSVYYFEPLEIHII